MQIIGFINCQLEVKENRGKGDKGFALLEENKIIPKGCYFALVLYLIVSQPILVSHSE